MVDFIFLCSLSSITPPVRTFHFQKCRPETVIFLVRQQLCQRCSAKKFSMKSYSGKCRRAGRWKMVTWWSHWLVGRLQKIRARLPSMEQHHAMSFLVDMYTKKARLWSNDLFPTYLTLYTYICIHTNVITHATCPDLQGVPISSNQSVIFGRTVCSRSPCRLDSDWVVSSMKEFPPSNKPY